MFFYHSKPLDRKKCRPKIESGEGHTDLPQWWRHEKTSQLLSSLLFLSWLNPNRWTVLKLYGHDPIFSWDTRIAGGTTLAMALTATSVIFSDERRVCPMSSLKVFGVAKGVVPIGMISCLLCYK